MKLTGSNIVLIGGFNPHIIEPSWLMRQNVVEERREQFKVEIQVSPIGGGDRQIRFELDQIVWEIGLERIKLAPKHNFSPAPWITRLLETLPHTPIRAVGHNFHFSCPRTNWIRPIPTLPKHDSLSELLGEPVSSTTTSQTKLPDKTQINLTLTITTKDALIDANVHRGANNHDLVRQAIGEFDNDRDRIFQAVNTLSGQEVIL